MPTIRSKIAAFPLARKMYHGMVRCARGCGVPGLWCAFTGRRHVILTFHHVRPAGRPADPFDTCPSISADVFRQVLEYVRQHFAVLPLRELTGGYAGKIPAAAVTFDDGWRDNYDLAFPILRELAIPATIFVTTGKVGSSEPFWQQALGRMFLAAIADPEGEAARGLRSILRVRAGRPLTPELYRDMVLRWKRRKQGECMDLLRQARWTSTSDSNGIRLFLDAAEIREMAAADIAFGSHTVTHAILPHLSPSEIERELIESKATLENLLGSPVDMLAYPDGQYFRKVVEYAHVAGYRIAFTTLSRWLSLYDDRMCLPRMDIGYDYTPEQIGFS
jgi:peptidoglycan/xylan/chitin deacetylase (PgdA/CDA1 family)